MSVNNDYRHTWSEVLGDKSGSGWTGGKLGETNPNAEYSNPHDEDDIDQAS